MSRITRLKDRGDTIVEVLVCLAIAGSALTLCYGTARRSLNQIRDSQERGEMLSISQTQLERLKETIKSNNVKIGGTPTTFYDKINGFSPNSFIQRGFCITANGTLEGGAGQTPITNPRDVRCAVDQQGNFYMDNGGNAATSPDIVDKDYPYRVGVTYVPYYNDDSTKQVDDWYVFSGRFGVGGVGNSQGFAVVPLMYRQHP